MEFEVVMTFRNLVDYSRLLGVLIHVVTEL